ncbi:MAG: RNA-binding cell elongation regulator Jag/EloR [Oscillospiraceae bacterium]
MIKSIETTGRTEDDAISTALKQLGKTRDEVSVEVLERAKSGFLGIGGSPARVRVSYEERNSKLTQLEDFLGGLFERMGVEAEVKAEINEEENTISAELSGSHVGALIGRRGETLDAIQHLSNYVLNNGSSERIRVNIDAENYRAKRADALTHLAKKVAVKVVKYRRSVTLEPMNAYERHVIHTALQDFPGVTTYSTGTEPNRRVVVSYEKTTAPRPSQRPAPAPEPEPYTPEIPSADKNVREWH